MNIASCRIVGAMTLPHAKGAFDRAGLIVASREPPVTYLQVRAYVGSDEIEGKPLDREDFDALVQSEQAIVLEPPLDLMTGAALYVLRPSFDGRGAALQEVRASGVLLRDKLELQDGSWACLVREPGAGAFRDRWAAEASAQALSWAKDGHWERAKNAASRAFVLERDMSPERVAMLALAHDRCGSGVRAGGYLQMARRSRGDDFAQQIVDKRARLEQEIEEQAPRSGVRPRCSMQIHRMSAKGVQASLARMRGRKRVA